MITKIGLQTFFPPPYNQLFAVSLSASKASATLTSTSNIAQLDKFLQQLESEYQQSHTVQKLAFSSYANNTALYASQLPPWLKTTDIYNFIEKLRVEKPMFINIVTSPAITILG